MGLPEERKVMPFMSKELPTTEVLSPLSTEPSLFLTISSLKRLLSSNSPPTPPNFLSLVSNSEWPVTTLQSLPSSPKWLLPRPICSLTSPLSRESEVCSTNSSRTSKTLSLITTRKRTWPKRLSSPSELDSNNPSEISCKCNKSLRTISKKWPNASLRKNSSSPSPTRRSTETPTS